MFKTNTRKTAIIMLMTAIVAVLALTLIAKKPIAEVNAWNGGTHVNANVPTPSTHRKLTQSL